jgi:hypothetical protein
MDARFSAWGKLFGYAGGLTLGAAASVVELKETEDTAMSNEPGVGRQITVRGMAYAPTSEQGVVFLFGRLATELGFCIERVGIRYPDCLATRKGKLCRIEFEYWASSFETHGHDPKKADCVVCWHNDWESRPARYRHLEIIELKGFVDALPSVFVVGAQERRQGKELDRVSRIEWNVPSNAGHDDLVLMYRAGRDDEGRLAAEIRDIWKIAGPFKHYGKLNKEGRWPGLQAGLKLVVRLKKEPVTFAELRRDRNTCDLGVVRRRFIGKTDVTDYWPALYNKIVALNPKAKKPLGRWNFD